MLAFLKSRTLLTILALLLLAFCIWYFGPFIALGDPSSQYFPLGTLGRQLIAMAIVVAVWVAFVLVKRLRANSASDQLIAAVVKQPGGNEPASAEAVQLRERFEEAVATLKQKRRSGHSLYDLPWYVIIGAPGSGKTTALVNSGLNFPLEQRTGKGALRGVGGTRNCDWWFTDEAVLLDTAGRYTTQDSDTASDSAGWAEFLALLRKYRKRRPLNGVILTISAQDLLTQGQGGQEAHVLAVRRRLNELNKELRIQLPVYLMVTKCDLVAGFTEYFDDLAQDGRAQVWGVTFPYEQTLKGGAADACPAEFDALIARLNERLFARLEDERDVRRRLKIFGFPQQMAAMKDALSTFASEVFGGTRFDQRVLLRGIYFTSGTQVGNPIDRLLGAIGRRFAIAPDAVAPPAGKGRAYFIQRLLKDVLFAESGLAGIDRRTEAVKAAGQLGVYVAILLAVVLCIVAWSVSYGRNASYLSHVADAAKKLGAPLSDDSSLDRVVARLDAVRDVDAVANPASSSWLMGWGLNQRGSVGGAARRAYARELRSWLLPTVAARFRRHLDESSGSAALLYAYLKGYLLLVHPENLDKEHGDQVAFLAEVEWRAEFPADPERRESVSRHFGFLLENNQEILPISFDQPAVTRARRAMALASQPEIIYEYIKIDSASNTANDLRLDEILGIGAERVFKLKNGRLSDPVRGLYTKKVFEAVTGKGGIADFVERFRAEDWVWGDSKDNRPAVASRETAAAVLSLYEQDYVRTWKAILDNLQSVPLKDLAQTKDALQILAGPMSPVKSLLKLVDEHTNLKKAPDPASSRGGALAGLGNLLQPLRSAAAAPVVEPGAYITEQFAGIRQLVAAPGPIDNILARLLELQQKVQTIGPNVGGTDAASPQASAAVGDAATAVQRDAQMLPPTVGGVLAQVAGDAMAVVGGGVRTKLETLYQSDVVKACTDAIDNRYPFVRDAKQDVPLEDFGRLFGPGGAYDQFFKERLKDFVDTSRDQWAWRTLSSGQSLGLPVNILKRFHDAVEIRNTFFPAGKSPEVTFTVSSYRLSENTLRFVLEVAGQKLEDRNGPEKSLKFTWGPSPEGAAATFEGRGSDTQNIAFSGPWAWFKLVSAGTVQSDAPEQFGLKLQAGLHWAIVNVKAASVLNPLSKMTLLQRFQCN